MNRTPDRPPILRFLLMFFALLALATSLAALSHSAATPVDTSATAEPQAVAVSSDDRRPVPGGAVVRPHDPRTQP